MTSFYPIVSLDNVLFGFLNIPQDLFLRDIFLNNVRIYSLLAAFYPPPRSGKEAFGVIDTDVLPGFLAQAFEEDIVPMVDDPDLMKIPNHIRSDEDPCGEPFRELDPFRIRDSAFTDNLIEDDPRIIDMEARILEQEPLDHLLIERSVHPTGDPAVAEYHLHTGEFPQDLLQFVEVFRTIRNPCGGYVLMDGNREIVGIRELENRVEGLVVDAWDIPIRQESQVIVPEKDLSDTAPDIRIQRIHAFYMFDGMLVGRIEPAHQGIEPFLALGIKLLIFFRYDRIGGAVIITLAIVIEIVFRSFPLILGPLLGHRESEYDGFLYIRLIHMDDQIPEPRRFLKEIHRMDMCIDHRIFGSAERLERRISGLDNLLYPGFLEP